MISLPWLCHPARLWGHGPGLGRALQNLLSCVILPGVCPQSCHLGFVLPALLMLVLRGDPSWHPSPPRSPGQCQELGVNKAPPRQGV